LPYAEEEWGGIEEWFHAVANGKPKSQSDLSQALGAVAAEVGRNVGPADRCEWLDGVWSSLKDQRAIEEAGHSVEIIREEDQGTGSRVELAIPMPVPKHLNWRGWDRAGRYLVAPIGAVVYDSFKGAEWKR
jgi:hypothetical protein